MCFTYTHVYIIQSVLCLVLASLNDHMDLHVVICMCINLHIRVHVNLIYRIFDIIWYVFHLQISTKSVHVVLYH